MRFVSDAQRKAVMAKLRKFGSQTKSFAMEHPILTGIAGAYAGYAIGRPIQRLGDRLSRVAPAYEVSPNVSVVRMVQAARGADPGLRKNLIISRGVLLRGKSEGSLFKGVHSPFASNISLPLARKFPEIGAALDKWFASKAGRPPTLEARWRKEMESFVGSRLMKSRRTRLMYIPRHDVYDLKMPVAHELGHLTHPPPLKYLTRSTPLQLLEEARASIIGSSYYKAGGGTPLSYNIGATGAWLTHFGGSTGRATRVLLGIGAVKALTRRSKKKAA